MNYEAKDELIHYGMPRRSGRYPWGSGDEPYQHSGDFISRYESLRKKGMSETDTAKAMGFVKKDKDGNIISASTTELRAQLSLAKTERRALQVETAKRLRDKEGMTPTQIAKKMGLKSESSARSLLNEMSEAKMNQVKNTYDFLKEQIDKKGIIDVGVGVERELNISREKLKQAIALLEREGYVKYGGGVPQVTNPGKQTNIQVICPPGTKHKEIFDFNNIHTVTEYISHDDGKTFTTFQYPKSMNSKRLAIKYAEDGGLEQDGLIELRRGVPDLDLGNSHYAQVRILVDNKKYIKGMAVYSDNLPDGVDVVFSTNKKKGTPKNEVLKDIKDDPKNPFGSLIKEHGGQSYYTDKNGKKQLSLINKRAEEGDWDEWAKALPSQFLSKQSKQMIDKQLHLAYADKKAEFDEICSLTNPTVKKAMLQSFAEDCDGAAVHLKAAALPRQRYQVIIPIPKLKDTEVYAPNYANGEKVALVRFPHGGTFEIPILTVNNKNAIAKKRIGDNALDAVGINSKVAERLSGADFDGDTVMVIPTRGNGRNLKVNVTSTPELKGLKGFDPKIEYGTIKKGTNYFNDSGKKVKIMNNTQKEMGVISNLITDMTLKGAKSEELAKAVRHSMVVIDAEKHKLDYRKSEIDNDIATLKKRYQGRIEKDGKYHEGASTLISKAKSEQTVLKRRGSPLINEDGSLDWKEAFDIDYTVTKTNKRTGEKTVVTKQRTQKSTKMAEAKDAYELVSDMDNIKERAYADYANKMKSMANAARKEMISTKKINYSADAKQTYEREVESLKSKLNVALKNAPRERHAQTMANATIKAQQQSNPDMTKKELKKAKQIALTDARNAVGAKREPVIITDKEWEAIQKGAITESKLLQIINNTDKDNLRQLATPRATSSLSNAQISKIKALKMSGYTNEEIAKQMGKSVSTVIKYSK